jgi:hypothetical protein
MARELLFVTLPDGGLKEGFAYALYLARVLAKDIHVLVVQKTRKVSEYFEDLMTAITFAEAGEHDAARGFALGGYNRGEGKSELKLIVDEFKSGDVNVNVETTDKDMVSAVKDCLKNGSRVDMVILSPNITANGLVSPSKLHRLVRSASRPIVTMARNQHLSKEKSNTREIRTRRD